MIILSIFKLSSKKTQEEFSDYWGIILGGSSGFGYAAIEKLASHGMNIALLFREIAAKEKELKVKLSVISKTYDVEILPLNITALDPCQRSVVIDQLSKTIKKEGVIKLLLHSIARGSLKPLSANEWDMWSGETLSIEDIQLTVQAMSLSLYEWTQALVNARLFHTDARIIGLTSEGSQKYWKGYAAVAMAKGMLESLARYMAIEYAPYGLKTNLIQAGITDSPSLRMMPGYKELIDLAGNRNPMGRLTMPRDVANVIYLLCREEAAWINGSVIMVDGGEHNC